MKVKKLYRAVVETPNKCDAIPFKKREYAVRHALRALLRWCDDKAEKSADEWNRFYRDSFAYVTSYIEDEDGTQSHFNDEEWFPETDFLASIGFTWKEEK